MVIKNILKKFKELYSNLEFEVVGTTKAVVIIDETVFYFNYKNNQYVVNVENTNEEILIFSFTHAEEFFTKYNLITNWQDFTDESIRQF